MDPAVQTKVFEPFVRGDSGVNGTGLGLAIVRSSLEALGSKVSLESTPGLGTTVSFALLAATGAPEQAEPPRRAATNRLARAPATIAVIDDHRDTLELLDFALSGRGFRVVGATTAQKALALLDQVTVDLILLDVDLPDGSGTVLCEALKKRADLLGVPIFIITGHVDQRVRRAAHEAGCDGYLVKPLVLEALIDTVEQALGRHVSPVAGQGG
jgi:two-component system sensor histidine kinase TorS